MGAEGMAQGVRVHVRRKSLGNRNFLDDAAHAACGKTTTAKVDEQTRCTLLYVNQDFPARGIVHLKSIVRSVTKRNETLFLSFTPDENETLTMMNIIEVNADQFRISNTASV